MPALNPNGSIYQAPKLPPILPQAPRITPRTYAAPSLPAPMQSRYAPTSEWEMPNDFASKFLQGAASTFDPRTYMQLPAAFRAAKKDPYGFAKASLAGLATAEGLGSLSSGALLGAGVAPVTRSAGAGAAAASKTASGSRNALAEAVAAEKALRGTQMMQMVQAQAKGMRAPDPDQTIRNATRRMGFFRPDDPRALDYGMLGLSREMTGPGLGDRPVPFDRAKQGYENPEGFFFKDPIRERERGQMDDEWAALRADYDQKIRGPQNEANTFFQRALGSPVESPYDSFSGGPLANLMREQRYRPDEAPYGNLGQDAHLEPYVRDLVDQSINNKSRFNFFPGQRKGKGVKDPSKKSRAAQQARFEQEYQSFYALEDAVKKLTGGAEINFPEFPYLMPELREVLRKGLVDRDTDSRLVHPNLRLGKNDMIPWIMRGRGKFYPGGN